ncbi:MAG: hypothetical protein HN341_14735 [Verrucomicrobia bacterium]|nr:hypothetical protein [Verrucomicrobiota bacterium]
MDDTNALRVASDVINEAFEDASNFRRSIQTRGDQELIDGAQEYVAYAKRLRDIYNRLLQLVPRQPCPLCGQDMVSASAFEALMAWARAWQRRSTGVSDRMCDCPEGPAWVCTHCGLESTPIRVQAYRRATPSSSVTSRFLQRKTGATGVPTEACYGHLLAINGEQYWISNEDAERFRLAGAPQMGPGR